LGSWQAREQRKVRDSRELERPESNPEGEMNMNFKLIKAGIAAIALFAVPFSVQAADVPIKAPYYKGPPHSVVSYYNWSGFYVGLNAGYGFGTSNWDLPTVNTKPKGFLAGGTAGYNWQSGALVYGLEADLDWSDVKGHTACGIGTCTTANSWLSTIRGRLGYAFDRFLPYVTAGGAYGHVKATNTAATPGLLGASATPFGWTAGVGLEYAFLGNLTAKIEYLYVDLGKFNCVACSGALADDVTFKESIIRAGLNYRFSGPIFSRY
jgi:outer membrane immunogenic protein